MDREQFHWNVKLQTEKGEVVEYPFHTFWDPDQVDSAEVVGKAAAAQAYVSSGKLVRYMPLTTVRA